jgi:general secretion pathway protein D
MTLLSARCCTVYVIAALLFLTGCQSSPLSFLPPLRQPAKLQAAPPRVSGAIPPDHSRHGVFESRGIEKTPVVRPQSPRGPAGPAGDITLTFVDTDIREIARVILGTTLKLNYTIDPTVHGTATLETGTPLSSEALLSTLETLLNQNGATLVERAGLYAVVPLATATATNPIGSAAVSGAGTQVVPLRYAAAKDLAKVLAPYVSEGGRVNADPARNTLIISGDTAARQSLLALIRAFDIDMLAGQSFAIFPVGDGDPSKMAATLEKSLQAESEGPLSGLVRVMPLPRINGVLVASSQPRYLDTAKRFFRLTTVVEDATTRKWHVYYVQNGQSTDLENVLQRAFTPRHIMPTAAPGSTAPGAASVAMGIGPGRGGGQGGGAAVSAVPSGAPSTSNAGGAAVPAVPSSAPSTSNAGGATGGSPIPAASGAPAAATEPLSTEATDDSENRMRIIANPRNNVLLIYATLSEYSVIERMLRKIDIIPLQVLIEATIAEVTLNDELQYGTQFFLKQGGFAETLGTPITLPPAIISASGLVGLAVSKAPYFLLRALADVSKIKVLSAPQLLVMDNEPARLQVGQQVPILTGTATSTLTSGAPIVNSIDYHSTGVIMHVTPRVNSGGLVTLDISQEVSNVSTPAANTASGSPTFDDRLIRTRIAVQDGQTVVLAGLIRDSIEEDNNGIPFLKDIPLVGTLLSTQSNKRARTELIVLITPRVVHDQRDARALTEDLRNQLIDAAMVPQSVRHKRIPGSANPNGL